MYKITKSSFSLCYKYGFEGFLIWVLDIFIRLIKIIINWKNCHKAYVEDIGANVVKIYFDKKNF